MWQDLWHEWQPAFIKCFQGINDNLIFNNIKTLKQSFCISNIHGSVHVYINKMKLVKYNEYERWFDSIDSLMKVDYLDLSADIWKSNSVDDMALWLWLVSPCLLRTSSSGKWFEWKYSNLAINEISFILDSAIF